MMKRITLNFLAFLLAYVVASPMGVQAAFAESVVEAELAGAMAMPVDQWKMLPMKGMSGDAAFSAATASASFDYSFTGAAIAADILVGKTGGTLSVTVDGKQVSTIDLYRNRMMPGIERIALANNLPAGQHRMKIEMADAQNPKSLGFTLAIDRLHVANLPFAKISGVLECRYTTGLPVMRGIVTVSDGAGDVNMVTSTEGQFSFDALAPGTYTMTFERTGYEKLVMKDIALDAGQIVDLAKVYLSERPGARPLTAIRNPLPVRPVIVRPGDDFQVEVVAPEQSTGWSLALESSHENIALNLKNATFDAGKGRWNLVVSLPAATTPFLYTLRMKYSGGSDFQPRAVKVVPEFKNSLRIVHITDVHVYKTESFFDKYPLLAAEINLINPDLVVVTGDLTDASGYTDERWPESDQYIPMLDLWNSYDAPTFILPGNHDLSPSYKEDDRERWLSFFDVVDFSFDAGPYHFAAFDDAFIMKSTNQKAAFRDELYPEQLAWLENDLAKSQDAKMRVILFHVPLHNTSSKVIDLAEKYGVKLALYGHVHVNQVDKKRGTTYVQTGAAFDGYYRVINLDDDKLGEINAKKDGFSAFTVGTLKTKSEISPDGRTYTLKVKNASIRSFPEAAWHVDMPAASDYSCNICTISGRYPNGGSTTVYFTFDVEPKGETTVVLTAK